MAPREALRDRGSRLAASLRRGWFHVWQVAWFGGGAIVAVLLVARWGWPATALEAPFFAWFLGYLVVVDLLSPRHVAPERWRITRWFVAGGLALTVVLVLRHGYRIVG